MHVWKIHDKKGAMIHKTTPVLLDVCCFQSAVISEVDKKPVVFLGLGEFDWVSTYWNLCIH